MPDILIRNVSSSAIKRLKARSAANGRSLQAELKAIVERSAQELNLDELREEAKKFSRRFEGRKLTDSVDLLREDRQR
jgi:plasmid stability protein